MLNQRIVLIVVLMLGIVLSSTAQEETETPEPEATEMVETTPEAEATAEMTEAATAEETAEPAATEAPVTEAQLLASTTDGDTYIVQPGDTLFRIALRNGLTTAELAEANGITNPNLIFAGQEIIIPTTEESPEETPEPQPPTPEPIETVEYVVLPGDTLYRLAIVNDTTISVLVELNNIVNPNLIFTGQTLLVPATPTS